MAGLLIVWRLVQDYVNSRRIMGENLELPPLIVVLALMVGGQAGGIAGVWSRRAIVSQPSKSCTRGEVFELVARRKNSSY